MPQDAQPLERRLDQFETISPDAKAALLGILTGPTAVQKGERLREAGGPAETFWIVDEGWFFTSSSLSGGGRQVHSIHMPGDVLGLADLGWDTAVCDVTAATSGTLLGVTRADFRGAIRAHPSLLGFFLTFGIYDHTQLIDRLRAVGRMDAARRTAHFYCQVFSQQTEPIGAPPDAGYVVPLDQSVIGDAIGLTNISVSRMTGELEKQGLIERRGRRFFVPEEARLHAFCEFTERKRSVPLSWLLRLDGAD